MREAIITGGLPGLDAGADDVCRLTCQRVAGKNQAHCQRYPQDAGQARRVARPPDRHLPAAGHRTAPG